MSDRTTSIDTLAVAERVVGLAKAAGATEAEAPRLR